MASRGGRRRIRILSLYPRAVAVTLVLLYAFLLTRLRVDMTMNPLDEKASMEGVAVTTATMADHKHEVMDHLSSFHEQRLRPRPTGKVPMVHEPPLGQVHRLPHTIFQNKSGILRDLSSSLSSRSKKMLLQEKLDAIFFETGEHYQGDLWELSDFVPQWMKGMTGDRQ